MIKLLTLSERLTVANADHVLVTSDAALERMVSLDAVDRNAVTVLPNCPDLTRIPPHGQRYSQDGRITVGYLGNMNPQDRVDILLHAAHHIRYRLGRRDVVFVCIGNGSSYKDLLSLRAQLGVSDAVEFLGRRLPNVAWARLADCDMCVQPDPPNAFTSQTMMAKTSEYMALRKPIVTFDLPETRNVCGSAARYARGNSAPALAEEIVRLADDPELRAKLGSLARSRAEQCFNWRRYEGRLLDAYGYAHTSVEDIENPAAQVVLNGQAGSRVQRWRKIGEVRGLRNRL
jgi:glycosyltransferase involved in cell wall biosynthesis